MADELIFCPLPSRWLVVLLLLTVALWNCLAPVKVF